LSTSQTVLSPPIDDWDEAICSECLDDSDLRERIIGYNLSGHCKYCEEDRSHVAPFREIADFIGQRMATFFGLAVDQLPYESREGGYQGWNVDTDECLFGCIGLGLKTKNFDLLSSDLVDHIGDDAWCDYDWLALEYDASLLLSWEQFCASTKQSRRFFFHAIGDSRSTHPDDRSNIQFLDQVARVIEAHELIANYDPGYPLFRARENTAGTFAAAGELGPPPSEFARQSNRMNPPGISMFYGAETPELAVAEARSVNASVGHFETVRALRILDLASLPKIPGFFSEATRKERQSLSFLHALSGKMAEPVARDDRVHIDYVPTQIITEFLRDFQFEDGALDGIRYVTSLGLDGANVVLFATQTNVSDPQYAADNPECMLVLRSTQQFEGGG